MSRDKILTELFTSKEFNGCIAKMQPVNLQEDLKAEVGLILCELPETKLMELHSRNELRFFTVRIVLNLIKSFNSPFYKKFRKQQELFLDISALSPKSPDDVDFFISPESTYKYVSIFKSSNEEYDNRKDLAIEAIDNLYWYDREMLMLYLKHGNYRAIEKETGIPWESAYKSIQKSCKEIRAKVML